MSDITTIKSIFKKTKSIDEYYDLLVTSEVFDPNIPQRYNLRRSQCVDIIYYALDGLIQDDWKRISSEHKHNIVCAGIRYIFRLCNERGSLDTASLSRFHDSAMTLFTSADKSSGSQQNEFKQLFRLGYDNNFIQRDLNGYLKVLSKRTDPTAFENFLLLYVQHDSYSGVIDALLQSSNVFRMSSYHRDIVLQAGLHSLSGPYALEDFDSSFTELVPLIERISTLFIMSATINNDRVTEMACLYGRLIKIIDIHHDVPMPEMAFAAELVKSTVLKYNNVDLSKFVEAARITEQLSNINFWRGALTDMPDVTIESIALAP